MRVKVLRVEEANAYMTFEVGEDYFGLGELTRISLFRGTFNLHFPRGQQVQYPMHRVLSWHSEEVNRDGV